jgi:hypothetical protein
LAIEPVSKGRAGLWYAGDLPPVWLYDPVTDSDQPIMTASVIGAVVDSLRACPVFGITATLRCRRVSSTGIRSFAPRRR